MKVIIVFANYFPELGGIQTYVDAFGGDKTTWYSDPTSQAAYRDYITTLVNRYRENCNVLAWELMNEPRCKSATNVPCDPNVVTDWANATSAWIKADQPEGLGDQNHLVSVGDEGWFHPNNLPIDADGSYPYTGAEGVDTVALLDLPTIDFGTFHMYPDRCTFSCSLFSPIWLRARCLSLGFQHSSDLSALTSNLLGSEEDSWGATWINQHSDLAVEHNKPIILEEYGKEKASGVRAAVVGAWQEAAVNSRKPPQTRTFSAIPTFMSQLLTLLLFESTGVAGDLYWEISLAFAARYTTGDDTAIYLNDTDYTQLVTDHAAAMAATSQDGEPSADIEPSENIEPSADVEPSPDDA